MRLNFSVAYNEATGMNYTGASTGIKVFICPSTARANQDRDSVDPNDPITSAYGKGYGYTDYGPTVYVDIDPLLQVTNNASYYATPYRNALARSNGLLKQGLTRIAEITDGTSNTIAIGEDAGRDEYFLSPYTEYSASHGGDLRGLGPAGGAGIARRYWRWAEPDSGWGVSGQPNNKYRPMKELTAYGPTPGELLTQGNNAGANDELFSFHPGGVNCLFGDGSVRFIKDSISLSTLRGLVTPNGGEVISSDQY